MDFLKEIFKMAVYREDDVQFFQFNLFPSNLHIY